MNLHYPREVKESRFWVVFVVAAGIVNPEPLHMTKLSFQGFAYLASQIGQKVGFILRMCLFLLTFVSSRKLARAQARL